MINKAKVYQAIKDGNFADLNKEERIEVSKHIPPLTEEHWRLIQEAGFATGSRVYGGTTRGSDHDWCVYCPPCMFSGYSVGSDLEYFTEGGFSSLYARNKAGLLVNILCFSDGELFGAWKKATQIMYDMFTMSEACQDAFSESKWKRVRVFRALVDIHWPVKELPEHRKESRELSLLLHKCQRCGREAINFTTKKQREMYEIDGICERCREKKLNP